MNRRRRHSGDDRRDARRRRRCRCQALRRQLRSAIRGLAGDTGDIKPLVDALSGYLRLRSGGFRVIYAEGFERGRPVRDCLFAERRDVVYELFRRMVLDDVSGSSE